MSYDAAVPIRTTLAYECRCECSEHPDCRRKTEPWLAPCGCPKRGHLVSCRPPARCASCKCRTWNREPLEAGRPPLKRGPKKKGD